MLAPAGDRERSAGGECGEQRFKTETGSCEALIALAIVAVAYAANVFFDHTAWGLGVKSQGDIYVFALFLPFGVIVPGAHERAGGSWHPVASVCGYPRR